MNSITQERLEEMVQAIVAAVQPERIILFGSQARGEAVEDSDIDLLIVEREGFAERSRWSELQTIRKALVRFQGAKDILLYSQEEVERWRSSLNHVAAHALREGRQLYERP